MRPVFRLENPIKAYDWGSPDRIPRLLSRPNPERVPQAELWMGAHPAAPSRALLDGGPRALDALIAAESSALLGPRCSRRFGPRLPFLLKLLAAAKPLSIQAHPDKAQAEDGWRRENAAGVPLDAPERNYKDDNHKPELLCALSPFTALCGFRPVAEIRSFLRELDAPMLASAARALEDADAGRALRGFLGGLGALTAEERGDLSDRAAERAGSLSASGRGGGTVWDLVGAFSRRARGDAAVIAPLYLNRIDLEPGRAIFLPAGVLHAYVEGFGVELMANSDNVLRGGLTTKHVDAAELGRVLRFEPFAPELLLPEAAELPGLSAYRTPAAEFRLFRLDTPGGGAPLPSSVPSIIVAADGSFSVGAEGCAPLDLGPGESVFVAASAAAPAIRGNGTAFIASVPE